MTYSRWQQYLRVAIFAWVGCGLSGCMHSTNAWTPTNWGVRRTAGIPNQDSLANLPNHVRDGIEAEAATDFVFSHNDFVRRTAEFTPAGRDKLREVAI